MTAMYDNQTWESLTSAPTVSLIIPTLNEAENLPYVLNSIPDWVDEVVLVDGRSTDDTERAKDMILNLQELGDATQIIRLLA